MLSIKFMFPSNETRRRFITFCPVLLMEIKRGGGQRTREREREGGERETERESRTERDRQTDRQTDRKIERKRRLCTGLL